MRVRAVVSFASLNASYNIGDEFDLPDGVDWLQAGFVGPVEKPKRTTRRKRAKKTD